MSASVTSISSKPSTRKMPTSTAVPPTITSTRPGSRPGLWARCCGGLGGEGAEHVLGRGARQTEVVDALGVVLGEAELDRGDGGDGAGEADERRRLGGARDRRAGRRRRGRAPSATAFDELLGRGRVGVEELLGDAHASDVERHQTGGRVGAEDELGGATADVDDEVGRGRVEVGGGAEERQRGLLLAREQLGRDAERVVRGGEEVVAVRRVARRAGGGGAHVGRRRARRARRGTRAARRRCARSPRARARACASTPWPSRVMRMRRSSGTQLGVARRRAVDVGDEEPDRVGADVDRGDAASRVCVTTSIRRARGCVGESTHAPTGSSPPARQAA